MFELNPILGDNTFLTGSLHGSWFAVQTWPRYEKKVASEFQRKGLHGYLPLVSVMRKWSDRRQVVRSPLFPGYVFVRVVPERLSRATILQTSGVIGFVGSRGAGSSIPESEIESVSRVLAGEADFRQCSLVSVGQRVRIRGGSLDGVEGVLLERDHDASLVVSIHLVQRSLAIRIAGYEVEPV
jgi:transcription antitermination factor NusG